MLNYLYKKYKDVHTIENLELFTLTYTIRRKECDTDTLVKTGTILAGVVFTLPITYVDGVYSIVLSDGVQDETLPDILFYNNLLLSLIDNVEKSICACVECEDCGECEDCLIHNNSIASVLAFASVHSPIYNDYLNIISESIKCDINEEVLCYLTKLTIRGRIELEDILLKVIGKHYLAFYFLDLLNATDTAEADYIKLKYKSVKMLKCLKKIGIDIAEDSDIFTDMEEAKVYYWQLPMNVIPEDGITPAYLAIQPFLDFSVFEAGYTVPYNTYGKLYFAIAPTNIITFEITDSLGNDVTDDFDKVVDNVNNIVSYISKDMYAPSNIFFKFKPVTYV